MIKQKLSFLACLAMLFHWQPLLADGTIESRFLEDFHQQVLLPDSLQLQQDIQQLKKLLLEFKQRPGDSMLPLMHEGFRSLVRSWKAVQTVYVAGSIDEEYLDHPRYIDYFHQANESIPEQLERALKTTQPVKLALFKNSMRSINALEYLLFSRTEQQSLLESLTSNSMRRIDAALYALDRMSVRVDEIVELYQNDAKSFVQGNRKSISLIVNNLINSSYQLVNWRVGEAGGLVKKYQGQPSASRLEYALSGTSPDAIIAILQTHLKTLKRDGQTDMLALGKQRQVESEIEFLLKTVRNTLTSAQQMPRPLSAQVGSEAYKAFFEQLSKLHNAYYFMLIDALGVDGSIIDADGD